MVQEKYGVRLSTQEKGRLRQMIRAGRSSAQAIARARILVKTDEGWTASQVAAALDISERTVFRAKRRYAEEGLDEALRHRNQVNRCREAGRPWRGPPDSPGLHGSGGSRHGTLRPAGGQSGGTGTGGVLVPRDGAAAAEKNALKPWRKQQWCIPKVSSEYVAAMEDVLDLYAEPYDPERPVVCFDETSTQLLADVREPLPAKPGRPGREDYECLRAGTRNLSLTCEPRAGWRHVAINEAAHHAGLRPSDALAGGRGLPRCPGGPAGARQLEHASNGVLLRDLSGGRGPAASPSVWSSITRPSTGAG